MINSAVPTKTNTGQEMVGTARSAPLPTLRNYAAIELEQHMAFKNFKVETDVDGIALVTWDTPGRSMNVLDETSINELEEIVKQTSADAAVKGVVITSGKEALSAGADLSMLEGMSRSYAEVLKAQGDVAANQMLFDQSRRVSQAFRSFA